MTYQSCALWPDDTFCSATTEQITRDANGTLEAARSVCKLLESDGFGGDKQVFPLRTWAQPVDEMQETVTFAGFEGVPKLAAYPNARRALVIWSDEDCGPVAKASVNITEADCPDGEFFIKDWSENEGIAQLLTEAGWIEPTGVVVPTGHCKAERYRFTNAFRVYMQ